MTKQKKFLIHIGYGKTGSTAIQSALAKKQNLLRQYDIDYPSHPSFKDAKNNFITSGNGSLLLEKLNSQKFKKTLTLFSREQLFRELVEQPEALRLILDKAEKENVQIEFICYVRDFFEHCFSAWGQDVKRGYKKKFDEYLMHYDDLKYLSTWIKNSKKEKFKLRIYNYANYKSNIVAHFFKSNFSISSDEHKFELNDIKKINRSLTASELEIQRLLNDRVGQTKFSIADIFAVRAPNLSASRPYLSKESYDRAVLKFKNDLEDVNKFIKDTESIKFTAYNDFVDPESQNQVDKFSFDSDQLSAIAEFLSLQISDSNFTTQDAERLLLVSKKHERGHPISYEQEIFLLQLSKKVFPGAAHIDDKINVLLEKIKNS